MKSLVGATVTARRCPACGLVAIDPAGEPEIVADDDTDFQTIGDMWRDEAAVKASMSRRRGGRKSGRKRRRAQKPVRPVAPLVTADEEEAALAEARRRIAEWEQHRPAPQPGIASSRCRVCASAHRAEIESWVVAEGLSPRAASARLRERYGEAISHRSIWRHCNEHARMAA